MDLIDFLYIPFRSIEKSHTDPAEDQRKKKSLTIISYRVKELSE